MDWIDFEINFLSMEAGVKEDNRQHKIQENLSKLKQGRR